MSEASQVCEKCGEPAVVHVTNDWGQQSSARHLCLLCADQEDATTQRVEKRLDRAAVYMCVGLMIFVLSVAADELKFGLDEGFGYRQMVGVAIAGSVIVIGAVAQTMSLMAIGVLSEALVLMADWVKLGCGPGFGVSQIAGCTLGAILMLHGLKLSRRRD